MRTAPPPVRAPREYGGGRLWKGRAGQFQTNEGGFVRIFLDSQDCHKLLRVQKAEVIASPFLFSR
jgi:hypothetical protein